MTRHVYDYKIVCSFDLPKGLDFEEVVSVHVRCKEWELFGPPLVFSHDGNLCFAQTLVSFEEIN